jgi:hypothetical protein
LDQKAPSGGFVLVFWHLPFLFIPFGVAEWEAEDANSKPSYVEWETREMATRTTTGDRTTVAGVVADKLFQKAKFVDRGFD